MKLYQSPFSSNARKAVMTAALLEMPVELIHVDLGKQEQRSRDYLKLNPNGKVPTLVDDDIVLWESIAIMIYLADRRTATVETPLYPSSVVARADINRWLLWSAAHFTPTVGILNFENRIKRLFKLGQPDASIVTRANAEMTRYAQILDDHLATRTWVSGATMTLADIGLACPLMTTESSSLPVLGFANLQRWYAQMKALPAWKATEPPSF